jgi:hypothetical protein
MKILTISFSITGLVLAALFLVISIFIFSQKSDAQGSSLQLFVTFPWFFIAMDKIPLWLGIIPNTAIFYYLGSGIESLVKKLFLLF